MWTEGVLLVLTHCQNWIRKENHKLSEIVCVYIYISIYKLSEIVDVHFPFTTIWKWSSFHFCNWRWTTVQKYSYWSFLTVKGCFRWMGEDWPSGHGLFSSALMLGQLLRASGKVDKTWVRYIQYPLRYRQMNAPYEYIYIHTTHIQHIN